MLHVALAVVCMGAAAFAAPAPGSVAFPVQSSADERYLVDQNGVPFPIMGRTAWFVTSLSVTDYRTFIDDTAARGYNAIEFHVINHDPRGNNPPFNGNGDAPFLNRLDGSSWNGLLSGVAPDFTTPKEAYWSFVDGLLSYCESKGILVFLFPAYVGWLGGDQGWMREMVANGPKKMQSYGAWIATRYRDQKNLVWMMGGDMGTPPNIFNAAQTAVESALLAGLQSVTGQQSVFFSAEWNTDSIATDQVDFGTAMTLNGAYSFSGYVNEQGRRAYAHIPVEPAFLQEEPFDEEGPDGNGVNSSATQPVRRFQWWGWLSTTGGYISGNGYVWPFRAPAWHDHLDTQGSRDMARLNAFMVSIAWFKLVPSNLSGMRNLITAGGSSVNLSDYVAAAATFDGTLLVAYIPPDHSGSITVDMTAMSGPARARWFDPTSGAYTDIGSGLPNTGTRVFTPPGNNSAGEGDWALIIDTASIAPTPSPTPPLTVIISGNVSYCSNPGLGPVPNVVLTLSGDAATSVMTDQSGNYQFSSLASGGTYTVAPSKAARTPGSVGINTVDVVATQRHFLQVVLLTGCRLSAADVNSDSHINTIDVVAVQRFFLGSQTGTANTGKYKFTPAGRTYPGMVSDQTEQNYDTLVFGDVASPFVEPIPAQTQTPTPSPTPTPAPLLTISGTLLYCSNPVPGPVPGVTLTLTGSGSGSTLSDGSGNYTFSSLPSGGDYTVTPTKAALAPGVAGINTVDVVAIQRHFLVLGTPLSGCRLTAADVNGVGGINTVDVIAVQRFFLTMTTGIANVGKYQFTPVSRTYLGMISDQTGQNYDTLVFGDVASPFAE